MFNVDKSQCLVFNCKHFPLESIPDVMLQGSKLAFVHTYVIADDLSDDKDILRQRRALCVQGNMLCRYFYDCSREVKDYLFKTFCTNIYCHYL
jgi:hypothetical protein